MFRQALICSLLFGMGLAHIRMTDPPNRSSLWRYEEFAQYNPEPNYSDDEIWCANIRQFQVDDRCGVCGDPAVDPTPRANENGGRYGKGIIARTYTAGQVIPIHAQLYAPHGGYFEISVCDTLPETEACFQTLVLSNGLTYWPMRLGDGDFEIDTTAQLPANMRCEQCVLRLHYRGAQHWGTCDGSLACECDPNSGNPPGGMGCSEQQTFRSCADITIV